MRRLHAAPPRSDLSGTVHLRPRRHSPLSRRPRNRPANPPARRITEYNNHARPLIGEFERIRRGGGEAVILKGVPRLEESVFPARLFLHMNDEANRILLSPRLPQDDTRD